MKTNDANAQPPSEAHRVSQEHEAAVDAQLRAMLRAARSAEIQVAPSFESVLNQRRPERAPRARRWVAVAASVSAVAGAAWLGWAQLAPGAEPDAGGRDPLQVAQAESPLPSVEPQAADTPPSEVYPDNSLRLDVASADLWIASLAAPPAPIASAYSPLFPGRALEAPPRPVVVGTFLGDEE